MAASKAPAPAAAEEIAATRARAADFLGRRSSFRMAEALPWVAAVAAFFLFPDQMVLGGQTLIMVLFALSLDLILGFAGIVTLGHAAFFGIGAYAAALLIVDLGWIDPFLGLVCAAAAAAIAGLLSGLILLRYRGLALLVLTLSTTIMLQQLGNLFRDFTGGYDGIPGVTVAPLFGVFAYDLYGHTYYLYCLGVLVIAFYGARRIVYSPFGHALVGIRENRARMHALGSPVQWRLVVIYAIAAGFAGVAGALFAQTNGLVTLGVFDFEQSASVLIMLILGGAGWLYGAVIGAVLYMVLQNQLAKISPEFWQFGIGLLLVVVILLTRRGVFARLAAAGRSLHLGRWLSSPRAERRGQSHVTFPSPERGGSARQRVRGGKNSDAPHATALPETPRLAPLSGQGRSATSGPGAPAPPALEVRNLHKSFGALIVANDVSLSLPRGARHALIGPNGAGKTTLVNLITGTVRASAGHVLIDGENVTSLSQAGRTRRGIARTFQINQLFRGLTVLENVYLAIGERTRACNRLWRAAGRETAVIEEALDHLQSLALVADACKPVQELPYGRQRLVEIAIALAQRPKLLLLDEPAAGVPSSENHLILDLIERLDPSITVLIIEHDMDVVFRLAKRITVLAAGAVLMDGAPEAVAADERVRAVYLGERREARHG